MTDANKRQEVLDLASAAVNGDRDRQYGDPESNFGTLAMVLSTMGFCKSTHLDNVYRVLGPEDVAIILAALKMVRANQNPEKLDSWVDLAGYAACGAEVARAE